jgi:hypothetical protein
MHKIVSRPVLVLSIATLLLIACSGGGMEEKSNTYNKLRNVPTKTWTKLSHKKIYFGHQSVGFNIIDGIQDLMKEYPEIKLNILETTDIEKINDGGFAHSRVGKNTDPKSKMDDFSKVLNAGIGKKADAAAIKFCYVDINAETDVQKLFNKYKNEITGIQKGYPHIKIIHFTAPLKRLQSGWKAAIKKLIGKPLKESEDNIKRNEYNELLVSEYQGKAPIFDIAQIESTNPDGSRCSFEEDSKTYYSLVPKYTNDGGHLNEIGRKKVAEQFLLLLANLN